MRVLPNEFSSTTWESGYLRAPLHSDWSLAEQRATQARIAQQCRSAVDTLAPRQRDVLTAMVAGYSNKQIAHLLTLSPRTVEVYRAGMMSRLNVRTLAQTLYIAFMAGLVPTDMISFGTGWASPSPADVTRPGGAADCAFPGTARSSGSADLELRSADV